MGKVLLAGAAYLVAVAMLSRGPLGAIRILGPRLHQVLDLALVAGLIVSPIMVQRAVSHADLDTTGIIIVEALAIVLLRMAFRTHYVTPPVPVGAEPRLAVPAGGTAGGRAGAPPGAARPQTTTASRTAGVPAARPSRDPAEEDGDGAPPGAAKPPADTAGGGAGVPAAAEEGGDGVPPGAAKPPAEQRPVPSTAWTLGVLAARARRRGSGSDRALGEGARRLGTALGRANRRRSD